MPRRRPRLGTQHSAGGSDKYPAGISVGGSAAGMRHSKDCPHWVHWGAVGGLGTAPQKPMIWRISLEFGAFHPFHALRAIPAAGQMLRQLTRYRCDGLMCGRRDPHAAFSCGDTDVGRPAGECTRLQAAASSTQLIENNRDPTAAYHAIVFTAQSCVWHARSAGDQNAAWCAFGSVAKSDLMQAIFLVDSDEA